MRASAGRDPPPWSAGRAPPPLAGAEAARRPRRPRWASEPDTARLVDLPGAWPMACRIRSACAHSTMREIRGRRLDRLVGNQVLLPYPSTG